MENNNSATITYTVKIVGIAGSNNPERIHAWMHDRGIADLQEYARTAAATEPHISQPRGGVETLTRVGWQRHACLGLVSRGDVYYASACCLEVWHDPEGRKHLVEVWETGDFSGHSHWCTVLCAL